MILVYSNHARQRMTRRRITESDVELAISNADIEHSDRDGNPCYVKTVRGKRIRVVIARGSNPSKVITVIDLDE